MNETEFLRYTDAIFTRIEAAIDDNDLDADYLVSGNVLDIEFSDGAKIIVNRHTANQELWIAAKSGGYHFAFRDGRWIAARDGSEFFSTLSAAIAAACGETIEFDE
ncbi:iron donor protein CyaY [Chromobacterium haemolyticum]|uniref:Iron-sulfur cluster assembly protein CyaY n=1 Tax=Chromobacterium fluminis TaxID=3044269 RepID=A0ABX0L2C5_9NEIS|nr:iron donor protein CyaY [Chromobacterium haemolyticum]NHR03822.1 iron donor protein CyaY [Chromobacterium haemolyticum]OQS36162.1 iron donor protein CyaY [Chromobacterium haemolyticum]